MFDRYEDTKKGRAIVKREQLIAHIIIYFKNVIPIAIITKHTKTKPTNKRLLVAKYLNFL